MLTFQPQQQNQSILSSLMLSIFILSLGITSIAHCALDCSALADLCKEPTDELLSLKAGEVFEAVAFYSDRMVQDLGSCGYVTSTIPEFKIALPTPFMYMSGMPDICNPNCNILCGLMLTVTNVANGAQITAMITDTALTEEMAVVLSRNAYEALGGSVDNGRIVVTFKTGPTRRRSLPRVFNRIK